MSDRARHGRWPDLFVVGAGRSGTTALHQILADQPGLWPSAHKSPNHFVADIPQPEWETPAAVAMARHWIADPDRYRAEFDGAGPDDLLVDVSPVLLQTVLSAPRIHAVNPNARIVAILRDPAERAYAHFLGRRRDGIETRADFGAWLDATADIALPDVTAFGHYVGCSRYHHFLRPFRERFGTEQVLVVFYDDFVADPTAVVDRIRAHVGLGPAGSPVDLGADRPNRSGEITNPLIRRAWTASIGIRTRLRPYLPERLRRAVGHQVLADLERSPMRAEWRQRVIDVLRPDIEALAAVTGRDLTAWLD